MEYRINRLLLRDGDDIKCYLGPHEAMKLLAKEFGMRFNRLARIVFDDDEIHNYYEGGHRKGLTCMDTLMAGCVYTDGSMLLCMVVDMGCEQLPVGMMFSTDDKPTVTPIYLDDARFQKKLSKEEVHEMFKRIFDDPSLIDIIEIEKKEL